MIKAKQLARMTGKLLTKNSPVIFVSLGIIGVGFTTYQAIRATPKALKIVEELKKETPNLKKLDIVKATWRVYVPTTISGVSTILCILAGSSIQSKRLAAIAGLYTASEKAFDNYREKVENTFGTKKEKMIQDELAKDALAANPVGDHVVYHTGKGSTLCYDKFRGYYFYSDIESIRKSINETNERLIRDGYVSLNDLYYLLEIEECEMGNLMGWELDANGILRIEEIFSSQLTPEGRPCLVLQYSVYPKYS